MASASGARRRQRSGKRRGSCDSPQFCSCLDIAHHEDVTQPTAPTAVQERQQARCSVRISCELTLSGETFFAETKNLSNGGAAVWCPQALSAGEVITVNLFLTEDGIEDPDRPGFECAASVRWCSEAGNRHVAGLQFIAPSDEQRAVLADFLARVG